MKHPPAVITWIRPDGVRSYTAAKVDSCQELTALWDDHIRCEKAPGRVMHAECAEKEMEKFVFVDQGEKAQNN